MENNQLSIFDFMETTTSTPRVDTTVVMQTTGNVSEEETNGLTDFGKKIGFARKDLWHERYLGYSDIAKMSEKEKREYVTKNNVFPTPKWKELAESEGYEKLVLFAKKKIRDSLPTVPAYRIYDTDTADKYFIELVGGIRDALSEVEEYEDFRKLNSWLVNNGFVEGLRITDKGQMLNISKVHNAIQEAQLCNKAWMAYKMKTAKFLEAKKSSSKPRKKQLPMEEIKELREEGFSYINRDVTPNDILALGFRGGEFGNWTNQAERQRHLNLTYDAINNVATALGITPQQFLYPGAIRPEEVDCEALAVGFGSRGHSNALAHYEPLCHVINLTRMKGAGSLGHELGHAFDHMMRNALMRPKGTEWFAFENCQWKCLFTNENGRLALERLWNAIHSVTLTNEEAIKLHKEKKARYIQEIVDMFNHEIKKTVCSSPEDYQQFDETLNEYIYEISDADDFYRSSYDLETVKLSEKPLFNTVNLFPYRRRLKEQRVLISNEVRIMRGIAENSNTEIAQTKFVRDAKIIDVNYSKSGHGYWNSDVELFARAWACYLKDKLLEKGIVDDYLCGHADHEPIVHGRTGEKVYTSPQGKRKKAHQRSV